MLPVYIVILNYKKWEDLAECLETLFRSDYSHFTVIVIDNDSRNNSLEKLVHWAENNTTFSNRLSYFSRNIIRKPISYQYFTSATFAGAAAPADLPRVVFIQNTENKGFAGGINPVLTYLLKENAYIWLLNPDMIVEEDTLSALASFATDNPVKSIIGSVIRYYSAPKKVHLYAGGKINFNSGTVSLIKDKSDLKEMDYISGGSLFTHAQNFNQLGVLPESYFLYWEETDWCYRAKLKGYLLCLCETAICYDKVSSSIGKSFLADYYYTRNGLQFLSKYKKSKVRVALSFVLFRFLKKLLAVSRPAPKVSTAACNHSYTTLAMKTNKYFIFVFIYFFVNSLALPFGLTYTALLSPLFYVWFLRSRKKEMLWPFFIGLAPFIIIHLIEGADARTYGISVINYAAVYIFCLACFAFLKTCLHPEVIFRKLLTINFLLCLVAIPLYFTSGKNILWMQNELTDGVDNFWRLKLFTYEPSYYAALFVPLFLFYFLQVMLRQNRLNSWLLLSMLLLPFLLSFSIGVITSLLIAGLVMFAIYFNTLIRKKRVISLLVLAACLSVAMLVMLLVLFPQNVFFLRLQDIISGRDVSGNGRTSDAFLLAQRILDQKNPVFGVGPGQIKIAGSDIIRSYYLYPPDYKTIAIPNAAAETLAIFGWFGFILRILVELILFIYTEVWKNYYRLWLFLFIFLYQFTGSFITNIAEYVIWIIAFTHAFPDFDVKRYASAIHEKFQTVPA